MLRLGVGPPIAMIAILGWAAALAGGDLDFERRVEAQRAMESVYHSHRIGQPLSFETAVPQDVVEQKVRTYLRQSRSLKEIWNTPVTAEMLQAELGRIARNTRFPGRLQEVYEVLGNDPVLIYECFAKSVLVNRLARSFFAGDRAIHREAQLEAERLRDQLEWGEVDLGQDHPRRLRSLAEDGRLPQDVIHRNRFSRGTRDGRASSRISGPVRIVESRGGFELNFPAGDDGIRYRVPKRSWDSWWSEIEESLDESEERSVAASAELPLPECHRVPAASVCGPDDVWDNGSLDDGLPEARARHTAVWTGNEMLVWGGIVQPPVGSSGFSAVGLRYDPLTDTWSSMSTSSAPIGRMEHTAVWTGNEMIVWGGRQATALNTGGRYDPVTDTWTPTSTVGAPSARALHSAVWTGATLVIWGGGDNTGGLYYPITNTWAPTSTIDAPSGRSRHGAVWTGTEMLVWGGGLNTGGRYDPVGDTWNSMSTLNAPAARQEHATVWTGTEMIIWGGRQFSNFNTGGRYDPGTDMWRPTSTMGAPGAQVRPTGVWTGSEMIVFGGYVGDFETVTNTGGRYDPVADTWSPTDVVHAPDRRSLHTAVWTGDRMVIWGGASDFNEGYRFEGGRYDPVTDSWTPTLSTSNKPAPRDSHSGVWTGAEMIIWGGAEYYTVFNSGFRYDPLTDDWTAMSALNGPSARISQTAVWAGSRMIVWGGWIGEYVNTGGRYDPVSDSWQPTSLVGAPSPRSGHTAVWTGSVMIVWGSGATGGRYDPVADAWAPTSLLNAPLDRNSHSAVWTGSDMVIWGGWDGTAALGTGGRYNPMNDTWLATSSIGAPLEGRVGHSAVWTGDEVIFWGGNDDLSNFNAGSKYRPDTDTWEIISTSDAPAPMSYHSAVWTGRLMIVWGGTGGRYDPARDSWSAMSTAGAPLAGAHSCVWTDAGMIVWDSYWNLGTGGRYLVDTSPDADHDGITTCGGDCDDDVPSVYVGAPEICDGRNNDCSHPLWPGVVGTIEGDDDGDAFSECQGDCDDGSAAAWAAPGQVANLGFTDESMLTWSPPAQPGGTVITYDTLRTVGPSGFATTMTCVEYDAVDTSSVDMAVPSPGTIAYYLARAQNACGLGSAGTASDGTPHDASDCQPPGNPGPRLDR